MTVQEYLSLPYNVIVRHISDESGDYYFAAKEGVSLNQWALYKLSAQA